MQEEIKPKIGTTFRGGGHSILVTVPATMTAKYGLQDPTNVIFIPTEKGILIKKFEVPKNV